MCNPLMHNGLHIHRHAHIMNLLIYVHITNGSLMYISYQHTLCVLDGAPQHGKEETSLLYTTLKLFHGLIHC